MSAKTTQRFVGTIVALVATVLILIALPAKPGRGKATSVGDGHRAATGLTDPRDVLPVYELVDGWWVLTRYGIRMRLPDGFEPLVRHDRPHAFRDDREPLRGSLNVLSLPNFFHTDLAAVTTEVESSLARNQRLELVSVDERTLVGGHPALRLEYAGTPAEAEMHFLAVVFLLGGHQVVITAAAGAQQWPELQADLVASLDSVERLDLPEISMEELLEMAGEDPGAAR
jgi:hypothetical protein